jgi:hypothetical protein
MDHSLTGETSPVHVAVLCCRRSFRTTSGKRNMGTGFTAPAPVGRVALSFGIAAGLWLAVAPPLSAQSPVDRAVAVAKPEAATKSVAAIDPAHDPVQAWRATYARALDEHLRERATRGDTRGLLAAALLWPAIHDGGTGDPSASRSDGDWFRAAAAAKPRDRLVAWREAAGCQAYWTGCDAAGALADLLESAPDDMTVQLLALDAAQLRGDAAAAADHLLAAAQAPHRSMPLLDLGGLFVASTTGVQAPPPDAQVAAALGRQYQLNRPATTADHAGILAAAVWAAQPLPAYGPLSRMCEADVATPSDRRDDCVRVMARLADSPLLVEALIGAARSVRLAEGEAAAIARERLRRLAWLQEHAGQLLTGTSGAPLPPDYLQRFLEQGELPALRMVLQANGIASEPPTGWLPQDPRMRALVQQSADPTANAAGG